MISPCLKAAAALQAISLESPIKPTKKPIIDDARRSSSPDSEVEKKVEKLDVRRRFVGDVDLPESVLIRFWCYLLTPSSRVLVGQEPLLMESKRRFVLFPIQYHEVGPSRIHSLVRNLLLPKDLANVQEG